MKQEFLYTGLLALAFLALFGISELLYHRFRVRAEWTRKLVHVGTGLLSLLFPLLLHHHGLVFLLCLSFILILFISRKFNFLKSIHAIDRPSVGGMAYPVSVYGCYLVFDALDRQHIYYYSPILVLAICDPIAALYGRRWPRGRFRIGCNTKTLLGSGMFLLSAWLLCLVLFLSMDHDIAPSHIFPAAFFVALIACLSEALSGKGYDNITIPTAVVAGLLFSTCI